MYRSSPVGRCRVHKKFNPGETSLSKFNEFNDNVLNGEKKERFFFGKDMKKKFIEIDHTADAAVQVWGSRLSDLFGHAVMGMYQIMFGSRRFEAAEPMEISCSANTAEELLVSLLNEINYLALFRKRAFCFPLQIHIEQETDAYQLHCQGPAAKIPANAFEHMQEIKAVTYHNLAITEEKGLLTTQIVFDL